MQESALGYERTRWAAQLNPLIKLWQSLMPSLPQFNAMPKPASGSPLDAFLASEAAFAEQIAATVSSNINSLAELVLGSGVLALETQVELKQVCFACFWAVKASIHSSQPGCYLLLQRTWLEDM